MDYEHFCIVLSGPSGVGKTTISRRLLELDDSLALSISFTTRPCKAGEIDGVHYYFVNKEKFEQLIASRALLEYTYVYGNYYGTAKETLECFFDKGKEVILDIDFEGALNFKRIMGPRSLLIYLLPPTLLELRKRLEKRMREDEKEISKRFSEFKDEFKYFPLYDYWIINDDLDSAVNNISNIINAERMKIKRLVDLPEGFFK